LSIAAVTYYGAGLVGFLGMSLPLDSWGIDLVTIKAVSIPVIASFVWLTIRRVKQSK
jgi:uncharacterized membrane-anchored protein